MNANFGQLAVMLAYYFPTDTRPTPDPAQYLRRAGWVQFDGSVWFGNQAFAVDLPVDEWKACHPRVRIQVVPFTEAQWEDVRRVALMSIERSVDEIRESLDDTVAKAQARFDKALRLQSAKDVKAARNYLVGAFGRARRLLLYAQESALAFDLLGDASELIESVRTHLAAVEEVRRVEADAAREASKQFDDYEELKRSRKAKAKLEQMAFNTDVEDALDKLAGGAS